MCRPYGSSRQQPYSTGDQKLEVRKSVRQKFLPCTPSHCSGEKLVDCILMRCFGQPELGDVLLPVIRHCQRRAIHFHLRMVLEEQVVFMIRA